MELKVFWQSLVRRWYLSFAVLFLTCLAVLLVFVRVGPTYEAQGTVLIFPPITTESVDGEELVESNPYLALDGLSQARDIVIRSITSKSSVENLARKYPQATFEATPDFTNDAPVVLFTVQAKDKARAIEALSSLMDRVPTTLARLQRGLDLAKGSRITSVGLTKEQSPEVVRKSQIRAALAIGAAVLCAGLLLIALVDGLLVGRRARGARGDRETTPPRTSKPETGVDQPRTSERERVAKEQ